MGDARLSLEQELKDGQPQNFDVLAVDAFSSDSIPVHLLTKEAMDLYFRHLRPDGILAVHISNRYLNLQPVLEGEVRATQKIARVVDTEDDDTQDVFGATWVLITSPATGFKGETLTNSAPLDSQENCAIVDGRLQQPFQNTEIGLRYKIAASVSLLVVIAETEPEVCYRDRSCCMINLAEDKSWTPLKNF